MATQSLQVIASQHWSCISKGVLVALGTSSEWRRQGDMPGRWQNILPTCLPLAFSVIIQRVVAGLASIAITLNTDFSISEYNGDSSLPLV